MRNRLERNCRILLHFYPSSYRKNRGAELVNTILDTTASDRHWPRLAETWSLITGGIRERVATSAGESAREVWRSGAQSGILAIFAIQLGSTLLFRTFQTFPHRSVWSNLPSHVWLRSALVVLAIIGLSRTRKFWQSCVLVSAAVAVIGSLRRSEFRVNLPEGRQPALWFLLIGFGLTGIVAFRKGAARPGIALPLGLLMSLSPSANPISVAFAIFAIASATLGAFIDPRWAVVFFTVWVHVLASITLGFGGSHWEMRRILFTHAGVLLTCAFFAVLGTRRYVRLRSL